MWIVQESGKGSGRVHHLSSPDTLCLTQTFFKITEYIHILVHFKIHFSHHLWSCHSSRCHSRHCWESTQCWEFYHVVFCDHDEEEDEVGGEKYVCQFWLSHSKFCWIVGSNVLCCLVIICIRIGSIPFASFLLKAHQRTCWCFVIFSFPQWSWLGTWIVTSHEDHVCITISLAVRCQLWWGSRGTWRKFQSTRSLPEKLGKTRRSAIWWLSRDGRHVSLLLVLRLLLSDCIFAIDCVRAFFLVNEILHDSMSLSKLQIWLWFCPSYLDWVGTQTPHRHMFNPSKETE